MLSKYGRREGFDSLTTNQISKLFSYVPNAFIMERKDAQIHLTACNLSIDHETERNK